MPGTGTPTRREREVGTDDHDDGAGVGVQGDHEQGLCTGRAGEGDRRAVLAPPCAGRPAALRTLASRAPASGSSCGLSQSRVSRICSLVLQLPRKKCTWPSPYRALRGKGRLFFSRHTSAPLKKCRACSPTTIAGIRTTISLTWRLCGWGRNKQRGASLVVVAVLTCQTLATAVNGPHPIAVYTAFINGAFWTWHGHYTSDRATSSGSFAQALTWDSLRMRQTEGHVRAFAARHGLERVSIALPGDRHSFKDARATSHGRRGHLWLGAHWFHPRHTQHVAPVLEHELAHVRRRDTRTRRAIEICALVAVTLAAGLLPAWAFTAAALIAWTNTAGLHWWTELACDAAAVRACGRTAVAAMWTADIADVRPVKAPGQPTALYLAMAAERATYLAARAWNFIRAGHRHPPLRLRRWFALQHRCVPAARPPLGAVPGAVPRATPCGSVGQ